MLKIISFVVHFWCLVFKVFGQESGCSFVGLNLLAFVAYFLHHLLWLSENLVFSLVSSSSIQ